MENQRTTIVGLSLRTLTFKILLNSFTSISTSPLIEVPFLVYFPGFEIKCAVLCMLQVRIEEKVIEYETASGFICWAKHILNFKHFSVLRIAGGVFVGFEVNI